MLKVIRVREFAPFHARIDNPLVRHLRTIVVKFDIDDYKGRTDRLRWDDLDFDAFRRQPLDDDTLRAIEYMHDVEMHTICYLRDILVTPAHADPDVTAFLSCWAMRSCGTARRSVTCSPPTPC